MRFSFEPLPPEEGMIANVRCAAFVGERVVVIDTAEFGLSAFPGGTLEPGESWQQALARELLEEAGARTHGIEVIGRLRFHSGADTAYRPDLPFPDFQQVVTIADVEIVGAPTGAPTGEHIRAVELIPVAEAIERLRGDHAFEADLLGYAAALRSPEGVEAD
jgi:8-oxo-dGTP pyrophosphatase MutT (NUDIX family)